MGSSVWGLGIPGHLVVFPGSVVPECQGVVSRFWGSGCSTPLSPIGLRGGHVTYNSVRSRGGGQGGVNGWS